MSSSSVDWSAIADRGRLAPTPHNAQPFRLRIHPGHVDVVVDTDRILVHEDRLNRYVAASTGIFLRTLEIAARAQGVRLHTRPRDEVSYAGLNTGQGLVDVAAVSVAGSCTAVDDELLTRRQTNRLAYDGAPIEERDREALRSLVTQAGHRLDFVDDERVPSIMALNAEAIIDNLQIPNERAELWSWTHLGRCPVVGDGLYGEALHQPDWELLAAFLLPKLFAWRPVRKLAVARHVENNGRVPTLAILRGPFDDDAAAVAAGRLLMDVWLELAARDIASQPFGSPLTNHLRRAELLKIIGLDPIGDKTDDVWFVLRLGHAARPPRAPHLSSIVLEDE
ncbi:MAG: hypothetical protein Q8O67_24350 [Deltaproteobacteria bacterium]|nr:hypothetical protein [Deltaproteobacteria bacterium]